MDTGILVVSGVAINVFAIGLTRFVCQAFFGQETQSAINARSFPLLGGINVLAFALVPAVALSWFLLQRTVFGLRLRSVGEHPEAADTLGVNVVLMRYAGVIISGALCGLGSAVLFPSKWISGMVAGRGFMALAAVIFGFTSRRRVAGLPGSLFTTAMRFATPTWVAARPTPSSAFPCRDSVSKVQRMSCVRPSMHSRR